MSNDKRKVTYQIFVKPRSILNSEKKRIGRKCATSYFMSIDIAFVPSERFAVRLICSLFLRTIRKLDC